MKKFFVLLLVVLLAFAVAACNGRESVPDAPKETTVAPEDEGNEHEEVAESTGDLVAVTYLDISLQVPAEATLIGGEDSTVGSAFMAIYDFLDSGRATVSINSLEVEVALLEVLGKDGLLETLMSDDSEIVEMFGRNAVHSPREEGGYQYWFLNDAASIMYFLTVGDAEAGSAADHFFRQILNSISILG